MDENYFFFTEEFQFFLKIYIFRMIAQLEHLTEVYLVQNGETILADQFFGLTRALDLNADRMTVELTFVKQTVENAVRKEGISITEGEERLDYDYIEPLGRLISHAKNSKILAKYDN